MKPRTLATLLFAAIMVIAILALVFQAMSATIGGIFADIQITRTPLPSIPAPPRTHIPPQTSPTPSLDCAPTGPTPLGVNLIANGDFETGDFGVVKNWAQVGIDLNRWYLVQDVPLSQEIDVRWVSWIDLSAEGRDHALRAVDFQDCGSFCSVSAIQLVPAQQGLTYTLSAEARREQGKGGVIYLDFLSAQRFRLEPHTQGGYTQGWGFQSLTAQAPPNTSCIRVILYIGNKQEGILLWDNISLVAAEQ